MFLLILTSLTSCQLVDPNSQNNKTEIEVLKEQIKESKTFYEEKYDFLKQRIKILEDDVKKLNDKKNPH